MWSTLEFQQEVASANAICGSSGTPFGFKNRRHPQIAIARVKQFSTQQDFRVPHFYINGLFCTANEVLTRELPAAWIVSHEFTAVDARQSYSPVHPVN
jgi:hypothetical protein